MNPHFKPSMPTIDEVVQWVRDRAHMRKEAQKLLDSAAALDKKVEAAELLLGAPIPVPFELAGDDGPSSEPMIDAAVRLVGEAPQKRLTIRELRQELAKIERFAAGIAKSQNYFYTMVKRLITKGRLVRDGKALRLPPAA